MTERDPDLLKENLPGPTVAIAAEALFLINLMLLPGLGFVMLMVLWLVHRKHPSPLVRNHLQQTVTVSLWGGGILVGLTLLALWLGGLANPWTWVIAILYFVCLHATLIIFGVMGLNAAILRHPYRYPVLGPRLED
ncbi:hypothetical protein E6C76_08340 [Pseudothauera nasutitermitis]|uniref:Tic20 family protein Ycf60 n=1 Tax=Pseudothauera nasutitermitis TaxID=2565930 RepID=A0A4S4AZG8_9RHOO|nr:hypothetical protein [Pseudothauera nasutitermitis]THF65578.1 hypothetical protein E6C76_08340 [Pseudothauera nasutitermitis]